MKARCLILSLALAALPASPLSAAPAVPKYINYQGYVTNAAGVALADANYDILFKIYNSAGAVVWGEKQTVTVKDGQFSILLGNGGQINGATPHGPLEVLFGTDPAVTGDLTIGLTVNIVGQTTEPEFTPRQQLLANPFAHRAKVADVATTVVNGAINGAALADGAVNAGKLSPDAITSAKILDGSVTPADLANNAVTLDKIADSAVGTAKLAAGAVTDVKLAAGAVTTAKIAAGAVNSSAIADGGVATADIANGAITGIKLAAGAIDGSQLADGSISNNKLATSAVSEAKLANSAVSNAKLGTDAVTGAKIADNSVTSADVDFADGTTTLNLYPSSGGSGTYMSMDSTATTVTGFLSGNKPPFRLAARQPDGSVLGAAGFLPGPLFLDVAPSVNTTTGEINGQRARLRNDGTWVSTSDERLKKDIRTADGLLARALKLRPVWFRFKTETDTAPESMGFIAQEVDKQLACFVNHAPDFLSLNYAGLSTVAIGAVQEQQALIEKQNVRIQKLEADNTALQQRLERLEKALTSVAAK
jgi:hypothetical protein